MEAHGSFHGMHSCKRQLPEAMWSFHFHRQWKLACISMEASTNFHGRKSTSTNFHGNFLVKNYFHRLPQCIIASHVKSCTILCLVYTSSRSTPICCVKSWQHHLSYQVRMYQIPGGISGAGVIELDASTSSVPQFIGKRLVPTVPGTILQLLSSRLLHAPVQ